MNRVGFLVRIFMAAFGAASMVLMTPRLSPAQPATGKDEPPRLVLVLVIDQARADYFAKLAPHLTAGLKRVYDSAARFENAHHDHALTFTGPGHATLVTGLHPSRSGIIGNRWYDRSAAKVVYCVDDPAAPILSFLDKPVPAQPGRSPVNMLAGGIPDWIESASAESRSFSISVKDRAAVLLGGSSPDGAFWYSPAVGRFVTSRRYREAYPPWLIDFNRSHAAGRHLGRAWEPLATTDDVRTAFGVHRGEGKTQKFSHLLGGLSFTPGRALFDDYAHSPLPDADLVALAKDIIGAEALGQDDAVDYLAIGFSGLDYVGHRFGPHSAEVLDTLLRLDNVIGELLDFVDERVGLGRTVVALTSDHGVMPLPEVVEEKIPEAGRLGTSDGLCLQGLEGHLDQALGNARWLEWNLYLDYETLRGNAEAHRRVELEARHYLEGCDAVRRVWTRSELEAAQAGGNDSMPAGKFARRYRNSFNKYRSPDLLVQLHEYRLPQLAGGTTHGTAYDYDTHVPMMFMAPGVAPKAIGDEVHTVDLAPTLASLLGLVAPGGLDGTDRVELLR